MADASAATDRSVPRSRIRAGDTRGDGRGRPRSAPAILHYGFRPFFLLASLHAALATPLWLVMLITDAAPRGPFDPIQWHAHEMVFGYVGAVVAGFVLTAVPNWTGRLPLSGAPLAGLALLWLSGRLGCALLASPIGAALIDVSFLATLSFAVWREVVAGRNWRNAPVAGMLTLLAAASLLHHAEAAGLTEPSLALRLALAVMAMLVALIGGRVVPSFTRNWLARSGTTHLPASFGLADRIALLVTLSAAVAWTTYPDAATTGAVLLGAGLLLGMRLMRWRGGATIGEPIVFILHVGYGWLALSLALMGIAVLRPDLVPQASALHALTAGAFGTMTLAVMTRASLGHTGREIVADRWTVLVYACVVAGALLRVAAGMSGGFYLPLLTLGGLVWSFAFLLFAIRYGPILCRPRL